MKRQSNSDSKLSTLMNSFHLQTFLAWISMIAAIFAGSAIGPMFKYMESSHITACLSASWRGQCMALFLIPAALLEMKFQPHEDRVSWLAKKPDLSFPLIIHVFFAGFGWSCNLLLWVIALQYTSTVQASILTSTHPLMLVLYFYFTGSKSVSKFEWLGIVVVMLGIITAAMHSFIRDLLYSIYHTDSQNNSYDGNNSSGVYFYNENPTSASISDGYSIHTTYLTTIIFAKFSHQPQQHSQHQPNIQNIHGEWKYEALGCLLCLLSSAGEVIVMLNRVKINRYLPLFQYSAVTSIMVTCVATVMAVILGSEGAIDTTTINNNNKNNNIHMFCMASNCIFGWMSSQWLLTMLLFGFVIGFVCITGFNYAVVHIPTLVFSSITLIDPLVTGLLSWSVGLEAVPDAGTWLGGVIVIGGVCLISQGGEQQKQQQQQQQQQKEKENDEVEKGEEFIFSGSNNSNNRINKMELICNDSLNENISNNSCSDSSNDFNYVKVTIDCGSDKNNNNNNDNTDATNDNNNNNNANNNAAKSLSSIFSSLSNIIFGWLKRNGNNNINRKGDNGISIIKEYSMLPMTTTAREEDEDDYNDNNSSRTICDDTLDDVDEKDDYDVHVENDDRSVYKVEILKR